MCVITTPAVPPQALCVFTGWYVAVPPLSNTQKNLCAADAPSVSVLQDCAWLPALPALHTATLLKQGLLRNDTSEQGSYLKCKGEELPPVTRTCQPNCTPLLPVPARPPPYSNLQFWVEDHALWQRPRTAAAQHSTEHWDQHPGRTQDFYPSVALGMALHGPIQGLVTLLPLRCCPCCFKCLVSATL